MTGLSRSNLQYMRAFAVAWNEDAIVQQAVGQLPWGYVVTLLDKLDRQDARNWYAAAAGEYCWSRNVPANMNMNKPMARTRTAPSNLMRSLHAPESELAQQPAKDPYAFEFLGLSGEVAERDLEQPLMGRIVDTLQELGPGFTFVGRQIHPEVEGYDFYIGLLFFRVEQLRYVVIELKTGKFQPEYAGKLSKNDHTVRYALGRSESPMAVSTYTYENLPVAEQRAMPAADELAAAFDEIASRAPSRRGFGPFPNQYLT